MKYALKNKKYFIYINQNSVFKDKNNWDIRLRNK
jgi:hypothetical protein